jgi:hypothetical protein
VFSDTRGGWVWDEDGDGVSIVAPLPSLPAIGGMVKVVGTV